VEDTSKPETVSEEMATFATTQKERKTSITNVEGTTRSLVDFLTTNVDTSASTQKETSAFVVSRGSTATPRDVATQHGSSAFITTRVSPTTDQNTPTAHHSFVVIAGGSVRLSCSSPVPTIFRWGYIPVGSSQWSLLYNCYALGIHRIAATVGVGECYDRNCTFHVDDLQLDAAGTFRCMPAIGYTLWSITVLGKYNKSRRTRIATCCFPD